MVKTKPTADTDRGASDRRQPNTTGHNSEASYKNFPLHYVTRLYSLRKHAANVYPMWSHTSGNFSMWRTNSYNNVTVTHEHRNPFKPSGRYTYHLLWHSKALHCAHEFLWVSYTWNNERLSPSKVAKAVKFQAWIRGRPFRISAWTNGLRLSYQSFKVNAEMAPQTTTYPSTPSHSIIHQVPTTLRHTVGDADGL
jgi:hypothetical protein